MLPPPPARAAQSLLAKGRAIWPPSKKLFGLPLDRGPCLARLAITLAVFFVSYSCMAVR